MVYGSLHDVVSAWENPKTRPEQPAGDQEEAGQVQWIVVSALVVLQPERGAGDGDNGEHEVDEKRPAPRGVRGQDATEEESERPPCPGYGAVDPKGPPPLVRIGERRGQEGKHRRSE